MKLYKVQEASDILGVTRRTMYRYIEEKKLTAIKISNEWRITEEALEDFIKNSPTNKTLKP